MGEVQSTSASRAVASSLAQEPAVELLNSDRGGRDLLDDEAWLAQAMRRWGRGGAESRRARGRLGELRALLRRLAADVSAGKPLRDADLAGLNTVLARTPVRARLERDGAGGFLVDMTPLADDALELAEREVAGSFVALLRRSTPPRLRLCADPDCGTAFVDETRNRRRRWCDSARCGNRARVRAHRARQRPSGG